MVWLWIHRGLYLTTILYRDDNILVTPEDQIPVVEIDDSYSSSVMQDFLWFTKVSLSPCTSTLITLYGPLPLALMELGEVMDFLGLPCQISVECVCVCVCVCGCVCVP